MGAGADATVSATIGEIFARIDPLFAAPIGPAALREILVDRPGPDGLNLLARAAGPDGAIDAPLAAAVGAAEAARAADALRDLLARAPTVRHVRITPHVALIRTRAPGADSDDPGFLVLRRDETLPATLSRRSPVPGPNAWRQLARLLPAGRTIPMTSFPGAGETEVLLDRIVSDQIWVGASDEIREFLSGYIPDIGALGRLCLRKQDDMICVIADTPHGHGAIDLFDLR